jgi:hypothetical protein
VALAHPPHPIEQDRAVQLESSSRWTNLKRRTKSTTTSVCCPVTSCPFERVVEEHERYWVVEKFTPAEVEQRVVTAAKTQ